MGKRLASDKPNPLELLNSISSDAQEQPKSKPNPLELLNSIDPVKKKESVSPSSSASEQLGEPQKPSTKKSTPTEEIQSPDLTKLIDPSAIGKPFDPEAIRNKAELERNLKSIQEEGARNVIAGIEEKYNPQDKSIATQIGEGIKGTIDQSAAFADDPLNVSAHMTGQFNKTIITTMSSLPKSVAVIANDLNKITGLEKDIPVEEMATYNAGQWLEDTALKLGITATNPKYEGNFWQSTIPQAFGSVAGIILTGGRGLSQRGTAQGLEIALTQRAALGKSVKETGKLLTSRGAITGGTAMAVPEWEAAKAAGLSDDEAFKVWTKNYFVGQTEILPLQNALGRINKASGGKLIDFVKAGVPGAFEEGVQETVQTILTNKIAQGSYDPKRDLFTDVLESGGAGAFVGMFLPGIGIAMKKMSPEQRKETRNILNDKFTNLKDSKGPKNVEDVVNVERANINPADIKSVDSAAETIENTIDAISKPSPNEVPVRPATGGSQEVESRAPESESQETSGEKNQTQKIINEKEAELSPEERASQELDALAASGGIKRDGNKITILTEEGGREAKRIYGELEKAKSTEKPKYEVKPVVLEKKGENFDYNPSKSLSLEESAIETKFAKDLDDNYSERKRQYEEKYGNVLDADNVRLFSEDYNSDPIKNSNAVHSPASSFLFKLYQEKLSEPTPKGKQNKVVFIGGGSGAGKSTITFDNTKDAHIVYNTSMAPLQVSRNQVNRALNAGKKVDINYVYRDPITSFEDGVIPRAIKTGRVLPITEIVRSHIGSRDTISKLQNEYKNEDRFKVRVFDNTGKKGEYTESSFESLPEMVDQQTITSKLNDITDALYKDGKISESIYQQLKGPSPTTNENKTAPTTPPKQPGQQSDAPVEQPTSGTPAPRSEDQPQTGGEIITPKDVHQAAKSAGVDYESKEFMKVSKDITGKEHLDDMTSQELGQMVEYIKQSGPKTSDTPSAGEGPPTGIRATVKKIYESGDIVPEVRDKVKEFSEYEIKRQKDSQKKAKDWIDEQGEDGAIKTMSSKLGAKSLSNLEENAVRSELIDRLNSRMKQADKEGDKKTANEAFDQFMRVSKNFAENITDQAQALNFLSTLEGMLGSKEGAVRFATREIEGNRKNVVRNQKPVIDKAKTIVSEVQNMTRDELLNHPKIQALLKEVRGKAEPRTTSKEQAVKLFGKTKEQASADRKKADAELRKILGSARTGIDPRAIKLLGEVAYNRVIESGISLIEFINEVNTKYAGRFNHDQIEEAWNLQAKDADDKIRSNAETVAKQKVVDTIVTPKEKKEKTFEQQKNADARKEAKKNLDTKVLESIKEFNSGDKDAFDKLAESLVKEYNVTSDQATKFKDGIKSIAQEKQKEVKDRTIKKYLPKEKKGNKEEVKRKKQYYEKVVELSDAGLLKDSDFEDQLATAMGMPSMTKEIADKIGDFVENIKKAPEGKFKNIAITNMLDYIAKQQDFNISSYLAASYKAGLFSGIDTQALNNISNAFGSLAYVLESVVSNPREGIQMLKSLTNPTSFSRALSEAGDMLRSGIDPRSVQPTSMRVLEQKPRSFWGLGKPLKGKLQALDPSLEQQKKYVFRALSAGDLMSSMPLSDMAQTAMFRRFAIKQGLKGMKIDAYIQEQMGLTDEQQEQAQKQAEKEYADKILPQEPKRKESIIKSRTKEIIEQSRNPEVVQRAKDFAQRQVFVSPPSGYTGIVAKNLNNLIRDIPILNAFIPVVNIAGNITQRGIEYTPPFALVRGAVHYIANKTQGIDFSTSIREDFEKLKSGDPEIEQRLKRFTAGMVVMTAVIGLLDEDDEGDNLLSKITGKTIKIHGGGPGTMMNKKPMYQKMETGWKPYTLQIGDTYIRYDLAPGYNVLLATMGEYQDAVRYGKMDKKDAVERFVFALSNSINVILKNSFLQSVTNLIDGVTGANWKSFSNLGINPIAGFAFPKFQRNLANLFDNNVYSAEKLSKLILRSVPILNGYTNEPILNALGEPVHRNWWDRIELWSSKKQAEESNIFDKNDEYNYSLPQPTTYNLSESLKHDVDDKIYNQFYTYRGEEIKRYFKKYEDKINQIKDNAIYEKTIDYLVDKASEKAKYKMGIDNKWDDVRKRFRGTDDKFPKYKENAKGKIEMLNKD